ncbi:MAG: hypothetical protein R3F11_30915 [Verrucomicrobiales bacterium]
MIYPSRISALAFIAAAFWAAPAPAADTVKNLCPRRAIEHGGQGEGARCWTIQATDPKTADLFKHLRKDGEWIVRDDAFIKYLNRHGGLTTIGYGSPGRTGVELEFGTVVSKH